MVVYVDLEPDGLVCERLLIFPPRAAATRRLRSMQAGCFVSIWHRAS